MTLTDNERQALIEHRISQTINLIDEVQFLIDNDKLSNAVNRIYYGMFYVLNALALKHKYSTKKHQQLIAMIMLELVRQIPKYRDFCPYLFCS